MRALPFAELLGWILKEYAATESIFGIHRSLFYRPGPDAPYAVPELFGQFLATPIGPAAGPHTQLAQNIVCAWLSGGRFIELKTVQIMDELEIPRPCIDVAPSGEGYNVEWSQELKLEQSAAEYVKAWVLIHVLHRLLGAEGAVPLGTVFNMSVGYNLAGIQSEPMVRFMDRLQDASQEVADLQSTLRSQFPRFADLEIPGQIANNVTLSTMHGCPPDEIERIARYLLEERGLHTTVKLNPTLLGKETVLHILYDRLGYHELQIPDSVFDHDLQYDRAVELIRAQQGVAAGRSLTFGVKLSNTLAMSNHRGLLPGGDIYMSGGALYPITINLFDKLERELDGKLAVSYSAGADALNLTTVLAAGARPVTAASDLLKPGGYSRFLQYLESLEAEMQVRGVDSLDALAQDRASNLQQAAAEALRTPRYKKSYYPYGLPKVESGLGLFDCITAPCVEQCAVRQDVPEYAWLIAQAEYEQALQVILSRNPLPAVTGYVCTHLCQTRCTRNNYEEPVAIRALKRFAAEHARSPVPKTPTIQNHRVAVIGAGPSGLAAGYFLALNGIQVSIYEAKDRPGGMLAIAPQFRLPEAVVREDVERITALGVEIKLNHRVAEAPQRLLQEGFDAVYVACGFQKDGRLGIEGEAAAGVFPALELLERVARGDKPVLGSRVLVIGGGNTAMDAARTAHRLTGEAVRVLYRRTKAEMPCEKEELIDLLEEGNALVELVSPQRVVVQGGHVTGLECVRNELGEVGPDGRRKPLRIEGSEQVFAADSIIVAVGQAPDIAFLEGSGITVRGDGSLVADPESGEVREGVYAGGDAARGPAIIIEACADGRRAAEAICRRFGVPFAAMPAPRPQLSQGEIVGIKRMRARREAQRRPETLSPAKRSGFDLVEETLTEDAARAEAARCVQCSSFCDKCVEVCPNRANYSYRVTPVSRTLPVLACRDGGLAVVGQEALEIRQARQIVHVHDFCNECGNCATFCVHQGKPYADKPRLFLRRQEFERQKDNAFYIEGDAIWRRAGHGSPEAQLTRQGGRWLFENAHARLGLSPDFQIREMTLKQAFSGRLSLIEAAEMAAIFEGVAGSVPFLVPAQAK